MQKEEYLIKNACYSVTKYYLCRQNNKRSFLGRKQQLEVVCSFPNRYLFSYTNKVTSLFSTSCILRIILQCNCGPFANSFGAFQTCFRTQIRVNKIQAAGCQRFGQAAKFAYLHPSGQSVANIASREAKNEQIV
ncbi:hypothetical protein [Segatella buccae]|uniref:hypothetical protein n=1 Tax=Segatella buccae TaxID=28126 RepID=UPI00248EB2CF|nr:hypothetical protein [Segatella buccae]